MHGQSRHSQRVIRRKTALLAKSIRQLERRSKQLLMLVADLIAIPGAFWTAITLRYGDFSYPLHATAWFYVVTALTTVPVFVHLGLYRAVIRFIGTQAALAIVAGVAISTLALAFLDQAVIGQS